MDLVVLKVIATSATFVIAVLGIFASYKLRKFTKWFDIASAFSAGIIIATAYTHMLPEAIEQYDEYMVGHHHDHEEPVAPQANQMAEDDVHGSTTPAPKKKGKCKHGHHHSHHHHARRLADSDASEDAEDEHDHHHDSYYPLIPFLAALSFLCLFLVERGAIIYMQNKKNHRQVIEDEKQEHSHCESGLTVDSPHDHHVHQHENAINCCKDIKSLEKMSEFTAFALIIAVSLHAIIEGMGMGAGSKTETVLSTFIGVAVHKGLEGFAVGANLIESNVSKRRFIMYSGVVCLASPFGALIGYLMTLGNQRTGIVGPILAALAVGTFIQVATMEFLPRTFNRPDHFWLKAMGLMIGFGVMSTMPIWFADTPHQHL
jgi:zinc transporter ZupT